MPTAKARRILVSDGKLSQRIWARGIITDYTYDGWNNLTNTVYSDNTPTVSLFYDAMGRQTEAHDAAGVTTFLYDSFGSLTNEIVIGVAGTNTIERFWDEYGRTAGYALSGTRQTTIGYDSATARIEAMQVHESEGSTLNSPTPTQNANSFTWNYLPGSDLKSSLTYPNGLVASWQYDANNQLLQVCNATPTNIISQYDYTYDASGRRVACGQSGSAFALNDTLSYGYNEKSELTNAVAAIDADYRYAYDFDDIGNRLTSSERGTNFVYAANQLNQYTEISSSALSASPRETFTPTYDDDGNQTLIKTATGIWSVTYNGENRPILWENVSTNSPTPNSTTPPLISMSYDRMGRRVTKNECRFIYDGYLQIADNNGNAYVWDPTEKIATRPLMWNSSTFQPFNLSTSYYTHDGNKNVSEVIAADGALAAHYDYTPFGAVTAQRGTSAASNSWRFSSECGEDDTATVYYNYRHYEPATGRWNSRDLIAERGGINMYLSLKNQMDTDWLGLKCNVGEIQNKQIDYQVAKKNIYNGIDLDSAIEFSQACNTGAKVALCGSIAGAGASCAGACVAAGSEAGVTAGVTGGTDVCADYLMGKACNTNGGTASLSEMARKIGCAFSNVRGKLKYEKCVCKSIWFFSWTTWEKKETKWTDWHPFASNDGVFGLFNEGFEKGQYETLEEALQSISDELLQNQL